MKSLGPIWPPRPRTTRRDINDRHLPNIERFNARYTVADSGCWEWTRLCNSEGYAMFNADGFTLGHRWSYNAFKGTIPAGFAIDHTCCNKACVNPEHLEAVTRAENSLRIAQRYRTRVHGDSLPRTVFFRGMDPDVWRRFETYAARVPIKSGVLLQDILTTYLDEHNAPQ